MVSDRSLGGMDLAVEGHASPRGAGINVMCELDMFPSGREHGPEWRKAEAVSVQPGTHGAQVCMGGPTRWDDSEPGLDSLLT